MRLGSSSPAQALHSAAGRYRLPRTWSAATLSPLPRTRDADSLYGIIDDEADAELKMRRLEAVLLIAREPLHSRKLAQYASLADGTEARTFLRRLNQWYDEVGRAFRVEQVAGGYQLLTRPKFSAWIRRQGHVPPEVRLSAPALETLAVVAYRQPVLRADVEAVRGVNCGEILRLLMERDLVRITGRSEELGRPFLYGTTRRFLEVCGLMSLEDLPRAAVLRAPAAEHSAEHPPLPKLSASGYTTDTQVRHIPKESDVSVITAAELTSEEAKNKRLWGAALTQPRMDDDDTFDEEFEDEDDDDLDDEDDELEEADEEEEEDDVDEDFDDEWEEVDDEELDEDEEDDEDLDEDDEDWDDDDEEDADEDEEEEDWE